MTSGARARLRHDAERSSLRVTRQGRTLALTLIVNYFRKLQSGPNDVLFFYYTGHGAIFEGQGHVLTTSHGNLLRETLRKQMSADDPRLCVIVDRLLLEPGEAAGRKPPMAGAPAPQEQVSPIMRCLFLEHQGLVDVTSSSFGEPSWSGQGTGGLFTRALTDGARWRDLPQLDSDKDGFPHVDRAVRARPARDPGGVPRLQAVRSETGFTGHGPRACARACSASSIRCRKPSRWESRQEDWRQQEYLRPEYRDSISTGAASGTPRAPN